VRFIIGSLGRITSSLSRRGLRSLNWDAAMAFTWLMEQPVKDTLCGTKVFWKKDYEILSANRHYFCDFDPFGDFDLLFGASN